MVELIIFDLDCVLVDAKTIHYDALNKALGKKYAIDWNEHLSKYDGLKTNQKLKLLTKEKGLDPSMYDAVWKEKQKYTIEALREIKPNQTLQSILSALSDDGYRIAVCSNSIRKTVLTVLSKLGVIDFVDLILSNEDVKNSKPHPEMYWKAMSMMDVLPEQTLIIEDKIKQILINKYKLQQKR